MVRDKRITMKSSQDINSTAHAHDNARSWSSVLLHRWPTVLGIAVAGIGAFDLGSGTEFSALIVVLALVYLSAALLARRTSAWMLLGLGITTMVLLKVLASDSIPLLVLLLASGALLVAAIVQVVRGRGRDIPLQSAGMVVFGLIALGAYTVNPDLGGYLIAVALLTHAAWDAYHYWRNQVVVRSYSEFCGVMDFVLGTAIIITLALR